MKHCVVAYATTERQHLWSSRPGKWLIISSVVDLTLISLLAINGVLMRPLAVAIVAGLLAAAVIFSLLLDLLKVVLFRRLGIS